MTTNLDATEFVAVVVAAFPALHEDLVCDEGLDTLQMGTLCRYTQQAISAGDLDTVRKCFKSPMRL